MSARSGIPDRRERHERAPAMLHERGLPAASSVNESVSVRSKSARGFDSALGEVLNAGRGAQISFEVYRMPCRRQGSGEATRALAVVCEGMLRLHCDGSALVSPLGEYDGTAPGSGRGVEGDLEEMRIGRDDELLELRRLRELRSPACDHLVEEGEHDIKVVLRGGADERG